MVGRAICLQTDNWFETRFSPCPHLGNYDSEDAEDGGAGSGEDSLNERNIKWL